MISNEGGSDPPLPRRTSTFFYVVIERYLHRAVEEIRPEDPGNHVLSKYREPRSLHQRAHRTLPSIPAGRLTLFLNDRRTSFREERGAPRGAQPGHPAARHDDTPMSIPLSDVFPSSGIAPSIHDDHPASRCPSSSVRLCRVDQGAWNVSRNLHQNPTSPHGRSSWRARRGSRIRRLRRMIFKCFARSKREPSESDGFSSGEAWEHPRSANKHGKRSTRECRSSPS